jgi:hypothetical protein
MIYRFKGNDSEMKTYTDKEYKLYSKAKNSSLTDIELKMKLSKSDIKLMKRVTKSVSTKSEDLLKEYIKATLKTLKS